MKLNRENQEAEIVRKIKLSWAAFGKLRGILENKNLAQHQNTRVFDMCLLPAMTYGSQMWTMTKRNMDRLIRTQRAMERIMLHITLRDRKRNTWIRARTRVTDVRERAARLKWQYAGHNARQVDNRWNAQILKWRPRLGKRERGRPQMRWEEDIKRHAGLIWK